MLFIDCGNSYTKSRSSNGRELKILSVTSKTQESFTEKQLWKIDGNYIGEDAIRHGIFQDFSLDQVKTNQSTFMTLSKFILCNYQNEDRVVFLFPFESYFTEKKKIIEIFSHNIDIPYSIGNTSYTHKFRPKLIKALPQGYTGGMDYFLDDDGTAKKVIPNTVLLIDIGFGTCNFIYLLRGEVIREMSYTSNNGLHQIYKKHLQGKRIFEVDMYNGYESLSPLYPELANLIKSDIATYYNPNLIDQFVLLGGGGEAIIDYIPWNNKILHIGQFSNVRGANKVVSQLSWGKSERLEMITN